MQNVTCLELFTVNIILRRKIEYVKHMKVTLIITICYISNTVLCNIYKHCLCNCLHCKNKLLAKVKLKLQDMRTINNCISMNRHNIG